MAQQNQYHVTVNKLINLHSHCKMTLFHAHKNVVLQHGLLLTYHLVLVKELQHDRWRRVKDGLGVSKHPDLTDDHGLVPCRAEALLHNTRLGRVAAK